MEKHQIPWLRATLTGIAFALLVGGAILTAFLVGDLLRDIATEANGAIKLESKANLVGALIGSLMSGAIAASAALYVVYIERKHARETAREERLELSKSAFSQMTSGTFQFWISNLDRDIDTVDLENCALIVENLLIAVKTPFPIEASLRDELGRKLHAQAAALTALELSANLLRDSLANLKPYCRIGYKSMMAPVDDGERAFRSFLFAIYKFSTAIVGLLILLDWVHNRDELIARASRISEMAIRRYL